MVFIERLDSLIKENGLTRSSFLKEVKMGRNQIKYWENHNVIPPEPTLERIARYFNVNIDYLTGKTDERTVFNVDGEEAVKVALFGGDKEVTPEMWKEVQDYVEFLKHKYFKDDDNAE